MRRPCEGARRPTPKRQRRSLPSIRYQPEIDGLRALAVAAVVLFHFDVPGFSGGFVGVDVFFVISGFLITRIMVAEIEATGRLSFARFYARRARRILPALFATVLLSAIPAFLLFSPDLLARFGGSAVTALLSVSNLFFWQESGYFDTEAVTKPLLHTWSLGVEEQFYLVWPLLILALAARAPRRAAWGVVAVGLASFALNAWFLAGDATGTIAEAFPAAAPWARAAPSTVFFLTPFRMFEFAIGAALVWVLRTGIASRWLLEAMMGLGLALIVAAVLVYDSGTTFPYFAALVPCAGTALVIAGTRAPALGWLLRNRVAVGLGLISYSVYLVHWPLVVFWRQYTAAPVGAGETVALVAVTILLALTMYRFVEVPFRRGRIAALRPRTVLAAAAVAALVLAAPAWSMWRGADAGWAWRIPPDRKSLTSSAWRTIERRKYCNNWNPDLPRTLVTCQNFRDASAREIFVWGDSHGLHLVAGISEAYPDYNVYVLHRDGCVFQSGFGGYVHRYTDAAAQAACVERNREALAFFEARPATTVILSSAKRATPEEVAPAMAQVYEALTSAGHDVMLLGDVIIPSIDINLCRTVPDYLISDSMLNRRCRPVADRIGSQRTYNRKLSELIEGYVDPAPVQCPADHCKFYVRKQAMFRDSHHLTVDGSIYVIRKVLAAIGRLKSVD